jgi:hypothetical protein
MVNVSQRPFTTPLPEQRVSNASTGNRFVQAKDQDMRDFRDAKTMAHSLRAHLAARGFNITVSQSLELIAELFGLPDWNTLAAEFVAARIPPARTRLRRRAQVRDGRKDSPARSS